MKKKVSDWLIAALFIAAAVVAWAAKPGIYMSDQHAKVRLEQIIPAEFAGWKELPQTGMQVLNPQQTVMLAELYSETLSRVYVHSSGAVVMLSLAYGANQSRDLQIHRPEVCYSAQGFQIVSSEKVDVSTALGAVPAMRLVAKLGQRNEPITYWVRIGEKVVRGNLEQGLARLAYGIHGKVADGILFRVSSISVDADKAYAIQTQFIDDLLKFSSANTRSYLLGNSNT